MAENQVIINAQTAAVTDSPRIVVGRLETVGLKSSGLAGSEVVTVQVLVNGSWVNESTLTVAAPNRTIGASGIYRCTKLSTAGAVSVVAD